VYLSILNFFPIVEKCGNVAYKLGLSSSLEGVHDIFYISRLEKCLKTPVDVVLPKVTPLEADLTYPEHLARILDQKERVTRRKTISSLRFNGAIILKMKQC
jgi:hypothetical protein